MSTINTALPSLFSNAAQWQTRYFSGNATYCSASTFANVSLPSIEILHLSAEPRDNYTYVPPVYAFPPGDKPVPGLNFCNVTISYTHPGWNDTIVTNIFLPTKNWNGRYQANGGGGYVTGGRDSLFFGIMNNLADGFAVSTTDGGHISDLPALSGVESPWALSSPGNVNWPLLVDFAYVSLHDMAVLSKAVVQDFYKEAAKFSYWYGGSTGGRQGHMFAQRYPEDFDGIVALFPAINWNELGAALTWPVFIMDQIGAYPPPCEINAITLAAIEACDPLDGVEDGLISRPDLCTFNASSVIGKQITCDGTNTTISRGAATVAQAAWDGPRSSMGAFQWYGYGRGANISAAGSPAGTTCTASNSTGLRTCVPAPFDLGQTWYNYWVQKDANATIRNITHEKWDDLQHASRQEYDSVIGTSDPDLSRFKRAGGKLLVWHGLDDQLIPSNGTVDYYNRVMQRDAEVQDYYRFFLAPGIAHEFGGRIGVPGVNSVIAAWVENGTAPEVLRSKGVDGKGVVLDRDICMYPKVQHYVGGDATKPEAFRCV